MGIRLSTGLQASVLSQYGLVPMMNYGIIDVYSGEQPTSASSPATGTRLGRITQGGVDFISGTTTGGLEIEYDALVGGVVNVGEWRLRGVAAGAPGWWRWRWNLQDDDSESLYYPRLDGAVGESLILSVNQISVATNVEIQSFLLAFSGE